MGIIKQCFTQIVMLVTLAMGIWCVYTLIHAVCDIFKIGQKQENSAGSFVMADSWQALFWHMDVWYGPNIILWIPSM